MLIDKLIAKIRSSEKILLVMHKNPDGDTLGAALSLFLALKREDKNIEMVCKDPVPKPFIFMIGAGEIKKDLLFGDFETIIVVDCGDLKMTGFDERLKEFSLKRKNTLVNIDHHPKNDLHKLAHINFVDYNASSASEIVWEILGKMNATIDKDIATNLLAGLVNDTGGFKHSNTTSRTLQIAAELLKLGAKVKLITKNIIANKSITAMKLLGITLGRLRFHPKLAIASSVITRKDLVDCAATDDDIAGIVNLINTIPDSKAAILFYETDDGKIRASIRTENDHVDVARLAHIFGGGGHKKAAGFTVDGRLEVSEDSWRIVLN